jgi:protein gp37
MGHKSKIEWTQSSWTPIRARVKENAAVIAKKKGYTSLVQIAKKMAGRVGPHCEKVSAGCTNCYSETNNMRCLPSNGTGLPFDRRSRDLVDCFVDKKILAQPLHWKEPRDVFVCSQTDLFGEWVPDKFIDMVFAIMALTPQHTYECLTKRPERALSYLSHQQGTAYEGTGKVEWWSVAKQRIEKLMEFPDFLPRDGRYTYPRSIPKWPLPNVWMGTSCEDQITANKRIHELLQIPAAVHWISAEPLLGPIDLTAKWCEKTETAHECDTVVSRLDWVVTGQESGRGTRSMDLDWVRSLRDQCKAAGAAFFMKQICKNGRKIPFSSFPKDLQVREFPR